MENGMRESLQSGFFERSQSMDVVRAAADAKLALGAERVLTWHGVLLF